MQKKKLGLDHQENSEVVEVSGSNETSSEFYLPVFKNVNIAIPLSMKPDTRNHMQHTTLCHKETTFISRI